VRFGDPKGSEGFPGVMPEFGCDCLDLESRVCLAWEVGLTAVSIYCSKHFLRQAPLHTGG
jgi:hypothetical protein